MGFRALWLKKALFLPLPLLPPMKSCLKILPSTRRSLDPIKTNHWPGKIYHGKRRRTRRRWALSGNPAGQIRKSRGCGFLVSALLTLYRSARVLSVRRNWRGDFVYVDSEAAVCPIYLPLGALASVATTQTLAAR